MARSRNVTHYPNEYLRIVELVAEDLQTVELELESQIHAMKLRGQFYAFTQALKLAGQEHQAVLIKRASEKKNLGQALTEGDINGEMYMRLAAVVPKVMVAMEGNKLIFQRRENSWQAKALQAGLAASGAKSGVAMSLDAEAAEAEKRFMEKMAGEKAQLKPELESKLALYGFRGKS